MNNIKMLYFDKIKISEGIYVHKTSASKECDICHYQYFLNKDFKFQPYIYIHICNRYHGLLMMSMNFSDVAFLNIKGSGY